MTTITQAGVYTPIATIEYSNRVGIITSTTVLYSLQTSSPTTTTDTSNTSTSTTSTSTTRTASPTKAALSSSSSQSLSSGAKIGLGVGIALGVALLLLLGALLFIARKRRQRRNTHHTTQEVSEVDDSGGKIVGAASTTPNTTAERSKVGIGKSAGGSTKRWDKPELEDNALPRTHGRAELEGNSKVERSLGRSDALVTTQGEMEGSSSEGAKTLHNNPNIVDEKERLYEI